MILGGINFALFVNLYSVMGFRLVAPPYNLPVSYASMIFLCYLTGTVTARLSGRWAEKFGSISGMVLGITISMLGMWVALIDSIYAMLIALLLISSGAFFLIYCWQHGAWLGVVTGGSVLYLLAYVICWWLHRSHTSQVNQSVATAK